MGPRKRLLKYMETEKPQKKVETVFIVENDGSLVESNEVHSDKFPAFIEGHPLNVSKASNVENQPSTSSGSYSSPATNSTKAFSRCGTVEATLLAHPQGPRILESTKKSWNEENRKALVRIMVAELIKFHSPYPPNEAKRALAKAIVTEFPLLRDNKRDPGYEHFYNENAANNRGFIENRLNQTRKHLSPSKKKYKGTKKGSSATSTNKIALNRSEIQHSEEVILQMISSMKLKMPNDSNKQQIITWMNETRACRRNWIIDTSPSISQIFEMYPRFQDFNGELIDLEFKSLFSDAADNLLSKFPTIYTKKILRYARNYRPALFFQSQSIENDDFRALLLLVELLPVTNSVKTRKGQGKGKEKEKENKKKGKKRPAIEEIEKNEPLQVNFPNKYLLKLVPEGTNLEQFVQDTSAKSKTSVQPYLVAAASQSSGQDTFINGDGWFLNVPDKGNSVTSFDLLYKIFYVFNLDYPDSLRNFYNFMDVYIYDMDVKPFNLVSSVHVNISNVDSTDAPSDEDMESN